MYRCCVFGCGSKSRFRVAKDTTYHTFPSLENPSLRNEWVTAVGRINWEPALTSKICSKHFTVEDYYWISSTGKKLKKDAVPSVNVGLGSSTLVTAKMSVKQCVVPTCSSEYCESPYFNFPKDKSLCLKWLLSIPKGGWSLNQESQVCSRHFDKRDVVVSKEHAWLKSGSFPKLYLESPTVVTKAMISTSVGRNADQDTVEPSHRPEEASQSASSKLEPDEMEGVTKIKLDVDDGSESDLEIIEPEIETYEVSDTSDEGEPPSKTVPATQLTPVAPKAPLITSLNCKLQINEVHSSSSRSNVIVKAPGSSTGRVIRGDSRIKCCVPRCGSEAGTPPGVGFHSFPQVGETRLSVRSLDNKLTVHDLFSMWKSLLSVSSITEDSYVCTRHFTPNDYTGNVLNKVAVPTQFLPTPVTFAPCTVQEKAPAVRPPPLILLNRSKNPSPILPKPTKSGFSYGTSSIRFPGIPSVNNINSLTRVAKNGVAPSPSNVLPLKIAQQTKQPNTSQAKSWPKVGSKITPATSLMPPIRKLGCSITNCPNQASVDDNKVIMFRLPHNIDKCKEWVYSCGHPEWLDKGMISARSLFRICMLHFKDDMFLDASRKTLKGSAKPTVNVQEPYKKCIVKHCHNYYDKDRLHYIGVDFATFPTESLVFNSWVKAVKGGPPKSAIVTEEDVHNFTGAVICSLHFRNSDYVAGPTGKSLSPAAVPSMNLVFVKEPDVPPPPSDDGNESAQQSTPISGVCSSSPPLQTWLPLRSPRPPLTNTRTRSGRRGSLRRRGRGPGALAKERQNAESCIPRRGRPPKNLLAMSVPVGNELVSGADELKSSESTLPEPELSEPILPKKGRPFGRGSGRRRGRRSQVWQSDVDSDKDVQENTNVAEEQTTNRRSPRTGTLYGPTGRPLRSAVLKRKSIVESDDGSESSDDEPLAKRQARIRKQSSAEDTCVRRNLRPRRAAARKIFRMDSSDSKEDSGDSEWQEESEQGSAGLGNVVGEHFLDPILSVQTNFEHSVDDVSEQPVAQDLEMADGKSSVLPPEDTPKLPALGTTEKETPEPTNSAVAIQEVRMSSDIEGTSKAMIEESTSQSSVTAADVANKDDETESNWNSGSEVRFSNATPEPSDLHATDKSVAEDPTTFDDTAESSLIGADMANISGTGTECNEICSLNSSELCDPDAATKGGSTAEKPITNDAVDDQEDELYIPAAADISDVPKEDCDMDTDEPENLHATDKSVAENPTTFDDTAESSLIGADMANISGTGTECNEICSLNSSELCDPDAATKGGSTAEKPITNDAVDDQKDELNIPAAADISDVPKEDCDMDTDEPEKQSGENLIKFGPHLPTPTLADLEFFRSIMPAVSLFNNTQKAELRITIVATLREMLNHQLDLSNRRTCEN